MVKIINRMFRSIIRLWLWMQRCRHHSWMAKTFLMRIMLRNLWSHSSSNNSYSLANNNINQLKYRKTCSSIKILWMIGSFLMISKTTMLHNPRKLIISNKPGVRRVWEVNNNNNISNLDRFLLNLWIQLRQLINSRIRVVGILRNSKILNRLILPRWIITRLIWPHQRPQ